MKKMIAAIVLLLALTSNVKSQETKKVRLSFVAEPQISWLKPDIEGVDSRSNMAGYNFGVVLDRFFAENYAFSTGLTINSTGGKLDYQVKPSNQPDSVNIAPPGAQDYHLRYIEVPLGLKMLSNEFRRSSFYARFGLTPQINIEARDDNENNISDNVRPFDLAYHLGAGLEYSIGGSNALMFGVLYHNGFTDTTKEAGYDDKTVLNRLVFEIGFIF